MVNSYTATVLPKSGSGLLNKTCLAYWIMTFLIKMSMKGLIKTE